MENQILTFNSQQKAFKLRIKNESLNLIKLCLKFSLILVYNNIQARGNVIH